MRPGKRHLAAAAALGALLAPAPTSACTISTSAVAFGTYNPQSATPDDGTGSITLSCPTSGSANPVVALGGGTYGTVSARKMGSGANRLNYNLYTTDARTIIWGDATAGTVKVTFSGGVVLGARAISPRAPSSAAFLLSRTSPRGPITTRSSSP